MLSEKRETNSKEDDASFKVAAYTKEILRSTRSSSDKHLCLKWNIQSPANEKEGSDAVVVEAKRQQPAYPQKVRSEILLLSKAKSKNLVHAIYGKMP